MNKAIIVIGLILIAILGGCAEATTSEQKVKTIVAAEDAALKEATASFVDDSSTVEIGEMI